MRCQVVGCVEVARFTVVWRGPGHNLPDGEEFKAECCGEHAEKFGLVADEVIECIR